MQNDVLFLSMLTAIVLLLILVVVLAVLLMAVTKANQKDRQDLKAENKDLLNRVLAKNTGEYKQLTNIKDLPEKPKRTLEDQLIEEGALIQGYPNPYPREL